MQRTGQRNASLEMQTESDESHCGTGFPSSHSTCPCHGSLSEKFRDTEFDLSDGNYSSLKLTK